jgi:hypothetical protein
MKTPLFATLILACCFHATALPPTVAELNLGPELEQPQALAAAKLPAWITRVEQQGGRYLTEPRCWHVPPGMPEGFGRLIISIDRTKMDWNLAATIVFDTSVAGDVAVQLFDAQGRAVVTDIFGNLVDVSADVSTNTLIIPWKKYPTASSVVIRRITGDLKVFGIALFPVVTEGTPVKEELEKLARVLGDPLSPENPLLKSLQSIVGQRKVALGTKNEGKTAGEEIEKKEAPKKYAAAVRPAANVVEQAPAAGLVAWWNFDGNDASDASGHGHNGTLRGGATFADSPHGRALVLRKNPSQARQVSWDSVTMAPGAALARQDSMTIAAWINYRTIAPRWGSQIAWFGDSNFGRDPWTLQLFTGGQVGLRTDRSVTGRPQFTVFEDEIYLNPQGRPSMNQHVDAWASGRLDPDTWYFVAGTVERISARQTSLRLYVNGEKVSETRTHETVNYPTDKMWMTIGAVDLGTWQNFDGMIDEVRLYERPLNEAEIGALYRQAWTR